MRIQYKSYLILTLFIFTTLVCFGQDPQTILEKADEKVRGTESAYTEMTIEIIRKKWSREMSLKSWAKGEEYSVLLLTAPAKDKGIVFLKREKEVWNWMPSIERTIKLPPSMMMQSWMGTDFTNDDLVKESSVINDYTHTLNGDSALGGRLCWKITLIPKPEAAVVWGKVVVFIDKKDYIQLRTEMYDEDGYLINIMNASGIKEMGGKIIATEMELIPVEKPGQRTTMRTDRIIFDEAIKDEFFYCQDDPIPKIDFLFHSLAAEARYFFCMTKKVSKKVKAAALGRLAIADFRLQM